MYKVLAAGLLLLAANAFGAGPVYIGLDAEFGVRTSTSAQAIQQGIQVAIDEVNRTGGVLGGRKLELLTRDNRSVTAIGVDNLRDLAATPDLVAVFGGKYSPIYIEVLPVAHALGVILLDPWGSADGITDHRFQPNYAFRLSLKDAWAAPAFLGFARQFHGATKVGVLLPNTAWGRSNQAALERAASAAGVTIVGDRWYNWGDATLLPQYRQLHAAGAQAVILVANEVEGALFVREMAALPPADRLPVIAHWGITGGQFAQLAGESLHAVDFAVIQTFSFIGRNTPAATRVLAALKQRYGIAGAAEVRSPVGVGHAYDLTHLLVRAIAKAGTTDRAAVRAAMEQLGPYDGLVQRYERPFTPERHDALSPADIFFARYTPEDVLVPIDWRARK